MRQPPVLPLPTIPSTWQARHASGETDEFLKPVGVLADGGLADGDVFLCFNFRSDRVRAESHRRDSTRRDMYRASASFNHLSSTWQAREMFEAVSTTPPFETAVKRTPAMCVQFTRYNSAFTSPIVFPPQQLVNGLSEWVSKQGLSQYHVAETEKYAHVTFFFNGGREEAFDGEERKMVDSPKVATYDLKPEMSATGVADELCAQIALKKHAFFVCNFAPPDMVGHTGVLEKAVIAAAVTDAEIGKIAAACKENGTALFITSDHGNCETMLTPEGNPMTAHSMTGVPFVAMLPPESKAAFNRKEGGVSDVAPTVLSYMGLPIPAEMTGKSFF